MEKKSCNKTLVLYIVSAQNENSCSTLHYEAVPIEILPQIKLMNYNNFYTHLMLIVIKTPITYNKDTPNAYSSQRHT